MTQRHSTSYGFVKTGVRDLVKFRALVFDLLADFADLGCDVSAHWILKRVPKSAIFGENQKNI